MEIGGGYLFPAVGPHVKFWDHVRTKLVERGVNISVAVVEYSEHPVTLRLSYETTNPATFP